MKKGKVSSLFIEIAKELETLHSDLNNSDILLKVVINKMHRLEERIEELEKREHEDKDL